MADDPRVSDLLLAWEEARARGEEMTAEELCRECPELTLSLVDRIRALRAVSDVLDLRAYSDGVTPPGGGAPPADLGELAGHVLLAELGRGGSGVVYKARQVGLDRVVAIKMLLGGNFAGDTALARFRAEARALARLRHPNIVPIHDIGAHLGSPYYSMEYLDGGNLAELLDSRPLEPEEAARVVEVLARTVHAVHQAGIIHRDLKPGNVLLQAVDPGAPDPPAGAVQLRGRWYVPKLTDFGLARGGDAEAPVTATGVALGTPVFMSPEQAQGKRDKLGPATDVYSLGVVLYQLMTATLPFSTDATWQTVQHVITRKPEPPGRRVRCPAALEAICLHCLEKDPARRYPTAEALADDLRAFLMGTLKAAGRRRWRRWAAALAAAAVVVATVLAVLWNANPEDAPGPAPGPAMQGRSQDDLPLRIAIVAATRGPWAEESQALRDGIRLAVEELKEQGLRLEVIDADEQKDAASVVAAAHRAVSDGKADLLIGGVTPEERKGLAAVVQEHKHLLLVPVPSAGDEHYEGVIFLGPAASQLADAAEQYLGKTKARPAVVVGEGGAFAAAAGECLRKKLNLPNRGSGDPVVPDAGSGVFELIRVAGDNPTAICIRPGTKALALLGDLKSQGVAAQWLFIAPRELESLSTDYQGCLFVAGFVPANGRSQSLFGKRCATDKVTRQRLPTDTTASAYAAVHLCAEAARRAKSGSPSTVRDRLAGLTFDGLGGQVVLDGSDYAQRSFGVFRLASGGNVEAVWTGGPFRAVAPPPFKSKQAGG